MLANIYARIYLRKFILKKSASSDYKLNYIIDFKNFRRITFRNEI